MAAAAGAEDQCGWCGGKCPAVAMAGRSAEGLQRARGLVMIRLMSAFPHKPLVHGRTGNVT